MKIYLIIYKNNSNRGNRRNDNRGNNKMFCINEYLWQYIIGY